MSNTKTYRVHIDIPIEVEDLNNATIVAHTIVDAIKRTVEAHSGVNQMNYRLGEDSDRKNSNYLDINSNGHCSHKKTRWNRQSTGQ